MRVFKQIAMIALLGLGACKADTSHTETGFALNENESIAVDVEKILLSGPSDNGVDADGNVSGIVYVDGSEGAILVYQNTFTATARVFPAGEGPAGTADTKDVRALIADDGSFKFALTGSVVTAGAEFYLTLHQTDTDQEVILHATLGTDRLEIYEESDTDPETLVVDDTKIALLGVVESTATLQGTAGALTGTESFTAVLRIERIDGDAVEQVFELAVSDTYFTSDGSFKIVMNNIAVGDVIILKLTTARREININGTLGSDEQAVTATETNL